MAKLTPEELNHAHKELKSDARKRVAERGILQFRADSETVKAVLQAADDCKMPVGAMLRQWVQERLQIEAGLQKAPDLVSRVVTLEEAVTDLKRRLAT